jgi:hypothetical protein
MAWLLSPDQAIAAHTMAWSRAQRDYDNLMKKCKYEHFETTIRF